MIRRDTRKHLPEAAESCDQLSRVCRFGFLRFRWRLSIKKRRRSLSARATDPDNRLPPGQPAVSIIASTTPKMRWSTPCSMRNPELAQAERGARPLEDALPDN